VTSRPPTFTPEESAELLVLAEQIGRGGVIDWDVRGGTVRLSPNALMMYGLENGVFDGRYETWIDTVFREDRQRLQGIISAALAAKEREFELDFRIVRPSDGELRWIQARRLIFYEDGEPVRVVGVSVDVTEVKRAGAQLRAFTETLEEAVRVRTLELEAEYEARKKAEDLLRQAQKMEAVGQLTGGVAHDFNNLLTIILGGLDTIGRQLPTLGESAASARIARARDMAIQGAQRAAMLTNRLLAFSRQQPLVPRAVDANRLLAGISELLRGALGETISLETVLAGGLWPSYADENQLENAILNLATNARDAMPDGGKVTIETANSYLDETYVNSVAEPVVSGQYVMIAVTDTGVGMTAEAAARAFEPFFTTKETGRGTGLGLSQVYGFVRQSSGHVRIYSEVGQGTTVKVYLPRYVGGDTRNPGVGPAIATPRAIGAETILLVEDDETLRNYTAETLDELGYRVLVAPNGKDAMDIVNGGEEISLLFTDVVMPGMTGRQLADQAAVKRPGLKVLFTTGYSRNAIVHHGRLDPGVQLLSKPYSAEELGRKLRAILDI
jgi:PAS domain S-box-containing protein